MKPQNIPFRPSTLCSIQPRNQENQETELLNFWDESRNLAQE